MFSNYLKIALRSLWRQKLYTAINIIGLALGIAVCAIILMYIRDELSFDRFHANADRIYRVVEIQNWGHAVNHVAWTMVPLGPAMVDEFQEVDKAVRIFRVGRSVISYGDVHFNESDIHVVDPEFFEVFSFPVLSGNPVESFRESNNAVLSESFAHKIFGDANPIGETIVMDNRHEFVVAGVTEDPPEQSHISYNMLISFQTILDMGWVQESWGNNTLATYLLLNENADPEELSSKLTVINTKYRGHENPEEDMMQFYIQPMLDMHLHSAHIDYDINPKKGDIRYVYLFLLIALAVLSLACINFMNLATARSMQRAREVGLRKTVGALRSQLVGQFLGEAVIIAMIALLPAMLLVEMAFPLFETLAGRPLSTHLYQSPLLLGGLALLTLLVGILSGTYPAFVLARFRPVEVLKGRLEHNRGGVKLRRLLVILQFTISILLIIVTGVVFNQIQYMVHKPLGFNDDHILFTYFTDETTRENGPLFRDRLMNESSVLSVSLSRSVPGTGRSQSYFSPEGMPEGDHWMVPHNSVDPNFIPTIGLELVAGRNFDPARPADSSAIIINEAAVRDLGWEDPIGKVIRTGDGETEFPVIGVLRDYHFYGVNRLIEPLILFRGQENYRCLAARIHPDNVSQTVERIEEIWNEINPNNPFIYRFVDENFEQWYSETRRNQNLFATFAVLAICIACLGLFGMAAYTTQRRTKEIGIRKVLGATQLGIAALMSSEFAVLVLISTVLASGFGYYFMREWLTNFPYAMHLSPWLFVGAGGLALLVALITVSWHAIRAAGMNPVKSIRYE